MKFSNETYEIEPNSVTFAGHRDSYVEIQKIFNLRVTYMFLTVKYYLDQKFEAIVFEYDEFGYPDMNFFEN